MKVKQISRPLQIRLMEFFKRAHYYLYIVSIIFFALAALFLVRLEDYSFLSIMRAGGWPVVIALVFLRFAVSYHRLILKQKRQHQKMRQEIENDMRIES